MTKWKYVLEWLFISLILHYGCSAYNISSEVCLEKTFDFALGDNGCKFTLAEAKQWLEADKSLCPQKCHIKINNLEEKTKWGLEFKYRLTFIALSINGLIEDLKMIQRKCSFTLRREARTLEIDCKTNSENLDISKDFCTLTQNCTEESKKCSLKGQIGICICKPGYIGFENKCLKGNLKLNETCQRNEQCTVAFGSVCQNDTCVCRRGYVPLNDSECFLPDSNGSLQTNIREQKEDNAVSVTVGSVLGGLFLGVILTVVVVTIYQHLRYGKFKTKECPKTAVFNNVTYETETDVVQNNPTEHRTNERKVVNVPSFAHSDELQKNRNVQEDIKSSMVNDDVYNHLHEKEENPDIDENYDHARGDINRAMEESDYSNLNAERSYKEHNVSASNDNDYDVQEPAGDYSSLKNKK